MKLCVFGERRVGVVVDDDQLVDVTGHVSGWSADPLSGWYRRMCRAGLEDLKALDVSDLPRIPLAEVQLRAPVLNPSKIVAVAMNYAAHRAEMTTRADRSGLDWRMAYDVFLKAPSSLSDPTRPITLPEVGDAEVHHEGELAFVIGTGGANIAPEQALAHVAGYTAMIDVTVRGPGDRSRRKSYDGFSPTGPWLVTADEIADPQDLEIELAVNGELRQKVNTRDMLVDIATTIAYTSSIMTLVPGDIFCTGAPPGVGPIWPGDVMTLSVSSIGSLTVPVAADRRPVVRIQ